MKEFIDFAGAPGLSELVIPNEIDSLELQFKVRSYEGAHFFVTRFGVLFDTVAFDEQHGPIETRIVTIRMVRHESESKVPAFMINE